MASFGYRLIVNADDFGTSSSANQAILQAHSEGILTSASLMVNGAAFDEAVAIARDHPHLGVGLHLCLVCGCSTLTPSQIPGLVDANQNFSHRPVATGLRYFFRRDLRDQLRQEIRAQVEKFQQTGLFLDHLNGHLNLHLHPVVLGLLLRETQDLVPLGFRLTRDPLRLNLRLASGQLAYRLSHALVFSRLSRSALREVARRGWRYTDAVFGLLQTGRVTEDFVLRLLPCLTAGNYELYSHPSLEEAPHECAALVSSKVKQQVADLGIELIRYRDL
jgi:hopanoid biosynthesis associated protein HpnK